MIGDVLDTLDGLVRLTLRTPTLDGSVPLRVARGCVPLLEGNAYGLQVTLTRPLRVRRRLGRWTAAWPEGAADIEKMHAAAGPRLVEEGYLARESGWIRALRGGLAPPTRGGLRLATGLLVRPERGVWLRVSSAANRRNTLFEIDEQLLPDDGAWVPLVLTLRFRAGAPASFLLQGEIACLGALRPGVRIASGPIGEVPTLAHAHARFYDRAYFEDKREDVTGKYRKLAVLEGPSAAPADGPDAQAEIACLGPPRHDIAALDGFTTAAGPTPEARPRERRRLDTAVFRNAMPFEALFDGHTLALDYDRDELRRRAQPVQDAWRAAVAGTAALDHPGAELYLTRYFTPHTPGEPHFFVKPWALTRTPPGWSSLVEGVHGAGYDVLRGIVATDAFHATPAVFRVHREGERIRVADDVPLLRVIPIPRSALDHTFRVHRL